jgi:hypothetical protein
MLVSNPASNLIRTLFRSVLVVQYGSHETVTMRSVNFSSSDEVTSRFSTIYIVNLTLMGLSSPAKRLGRPDRRVA